MTHPHIKNPLTLQYNQGYQSRKDNYIGFETIVRGFAKQTFLIELHNAAKELEPVVEKYAHLKRDGLTKAPSTFSDFLKELKKPKEANAVNTLGLTVLISGIEELNRKCEMLYLERVDTTVENSLPLTDELKHNIVYHLQTMLQYIDGNATLKKSPYIDMCPKLNEIISDVTRIFRAEKTRNENASEQNGTGKDKNSGENKSKDNTVSENGVKKVMAPVK